MANLWGSLADNWMAMVAGATAVLTLIASLITLRSSNVKRRDQPDGGGAPPPDEGERCASALEWQVTVEGRVLSVAVTPTASTMAHISGLGTRQLKTVMNRFLERHRLFVRLSQYALDAVAVDVNHTLSISRSGDRITIHSVSLEYAPRDAFELWTHLAEAYARAEALPFREDHNRLLHEDAYSRAHKELVELLAAVDRYASAVRALQDTATFGRFHRLKIDAENHLSEADRLYYTFLQRPADLDLLGRTAVELEMVVVGVHRIVLDYHLGIAGGDGT